MYPYLYSSSPITYANHDRISRSHLQLHQAKTIYNPETALLLATLCYQAYQMLGSPNNFRLPVFPEKFKLLTTFTGATNTAELFGFIIESDTHIAVVFRGTSTYSDWKTDVKALRVPFDLVPNGGSVHRGFYNVYKNNDGKGQAESMRDTIYRTLKTLNPNKIIMFTGHSLGGALATLSALDMAVNSQFKNPIVYTFGSPRVGNDVFANRFDTTIPLSIRIVNGGDPVTTIPPESAGYQHVQHEILINFKAGISPTSQHSIANAYFPGIAQQIPNYAEMFCVKNPPGFCPLIPSIAHSYVSTSKCYCYC